ncbi:hypothetical protein [Lysinibacillus antri]|uniref:Alpha-ribazole-5-phosphate synthase n=1 Tax=Lysinibacillus antri TaxID=2498145 RepID=A0A432LGJ5_9BACI|nr:hypothetical protein [Lysinibacillus antri]RUL57008.1 hypothetical protein EK386_00900 [Lysinibacillus antri]
MRNAIKIDKDLVVTIDNSGCIGEKEQDVVKVPNELAAYYSARVSILEQWCAGAHPTHLFLANFTNQEAWQDYEKGFRKVFAELGEKMPPLNGSTESNFDSLQSGLSLTVIGKVVFEVNEENCDWFIVGKPLVGEEVVNQPEDVAKLEELLLLIKMKVIKHVWPVGSKGIKAECKEIFKNNEIQCNLPLEKSGGPSTCVIVAVDREQLDQFQDSITAPIEKLKIC